MLMRRIYMIDCPGVVYPQGDSETQIILKGVVRVENVKDPENHVQGVLDCVKAEHLRKHYGIEDWKDVEDFMTKIATKQGRLLKGGEPDITAIAKCILNDFQRGKLPYFVVPPGCEGTTNKEHEQAPINETCADQDESVIDTSSEVVDNGSETNSTCVDSANYGEAMDESDDLTDVGSLCSGLSDLSGVSDLEDFETVHSDNESEKQTHRRTKSLEKRPRGVRAGKKQRKRQLSRQSSIEAEATPGTSTIVEFASRKSHAKKNMWRKKLKKKHRAKHQQ
uniref:G domain-containing protein n=1 Tax=Angiostrongylus cantonensis TaxID=6313 RepID=A0A0K0D9N4_ANGCA